MVMFLETESNPPLPAAMSVALYVPANVKCIVAESLLSTRCPVEYWNQWATDGEEVVLTRMTVLSSAPITIVKSAFGLACKSLIVLSGLQPKNIHDIISKATKLLMNIF